MTGYVIRWDSLPAFRETFPTIQLPEGADALGIEVEGGEATLFEVFGSDGDTCWDETMEIADAASLAAFADKYGDPCAA